MLPGTAELNRRAIAALVLAVGLAMVGVTGCGTPPSAAPTSSAEAIPSAATPPPSPAPSPSAETPSSFREASDSPNATPTGDPTATTDTNETTEPDDEGSERPPVLDEKATGRDLTLADFFSVPDGWQDGRFDVAGQRGLAGISGPLYYCRDDQSQSRHDVLELRLANRFKKVSMKVGQSDDSEQSDAVLNVRLQGNGKYIDSVKVPFNKIDGFSASVSGVNALKIEVWIGGDKCIQGTVGAVLSGLRLE